MLRDHLINFILAGRRVVEAYPEVYHQPDDASAQVLFFFFLERIISAKSHCVSLGNV
jgi:hypothetical protein